MRWRIIGIGSPFGLDRLGWEAIDALAAGGAEAYGPQPELLKLDRPGSLLLSEFQGSDLVILIDALDSPGAPGAVRRLDPVEVAGAGALLSGHALGLAETLALGQVLGQLPPRLVVLGIVSGIGPWPEPLSLSASTCRCLRDQVGAELSATSLLPID